MIAAAILAVATAAIAWSRAGLLDLPPAPKGVTPESAGLADLEQLKHLDDWIHGRTAWKNASESAPEPAARIKQGLEAIAAGEHEAGVRLMADGVRLEPTNLVYSNACRTAVFRLKRDFLTEAKVAGSIIPQFPPHLERQPVRLFEEIDAAQPSREVKLQLALAWVDEMLLFPALEIKAPASVEAVKILTQLIESGHAPYVPALFARGLNHLHRPARLVWPESENTPPDAAAQDIGLCVAIGRKLGLGSGKLQARLAIALGDAYVKAGRYGVARSWWQVAQNLSADSDIQEAVRRRYAWRDEDILDKLEQELDRARAALDEPMTDLSMMWN